MKSLSLKRLISSKVYYLIVFTLLANLSHSQKPNIIIIMADDLDSKQLSCYGGKNIVTQNLDALAKEGLKFNQMICSEAICVPTRASLFTGLYPVRHGSFLNHKTVYDSVPLKSVCHYLGDLGYSVPLTGKNHSTKPVSVFPFKILKGFEPNCVAPTDDYELDDIKQFITRIEKPYCLFIMSINPHTPWTMGDPSEFNADKLVLPPHWVDTKDVRVEFTKYLAEVRRLDNQVGDILKLLKETGQDKNTVVIFLGEQGPQFPGGKWTLWDNGVRSSMIVRWPARVKPNTVTEAIAQYEDVTPTLIAIAGGKPISGLDGKSFLPVLSGKAGTRDYAYEIHNNIPEGPPYPSRGIRSTRYKLLLNLTPDKNYHIKYMMNPAKKDSYWMGWLAAGQTSAEAKKLTDRIVKRPAVEFYDLQKDPYELNNLANDPAYKKQIDDYKIKLNDWMKQQGDKGAAMDIVYNKEAKAG